MVIYKKTALLVSRITAIPQSCPTNTPNSNFMSDHNLFFPLFPVLSELSKFIRISRCTALKFSSHRQTDPL